MEQTTINAIEEIRNWYLVNTKTCFFDIFDPQIWFINFATLLIELFKDDHYLKIYIYDENFVKKYLHIQNFTQICNNIFSFDILRATIFFINLS